MKNIILQVFQTVPTHLLQSAAGVIIEESDETYEKDLLEAGYEKMILPKARIFIFIQFQIWFLKIRTDRKLHRQMEETFF